jgi:hypothetical protein
MQLVNVKTAHTEFKEHCKRISKKIQVLNKQLIMRYLRRKYFLVQLLDRNWQTGKYELKAGRFFSGLKPYCIENDEDYILCRLERRPQLFILIDRRTMQTSRVNYFFKYYQNKITKSPSQVFGHKIRNVSEFRIHNKIIAIASQSLIRVFDATTIEQVGPHFNKCNEDVTNPW